MRGKRFLCFLMTVFLAGGGIFLPAFATENTIEFYVSADGSDTASGTLAHPFRTIERAKMEVAKYASDMTSDITVYVRGGTYYQESTLVFFEADSGTNGYRVRYRNYPGEEPVIYGGIRVTGWETYRDGIYKAHLPEGVDCYTLTENLQWAQEACYPNEGYLSVAREGVSDGRNSLLYFKAEDIPAGLSQEGLRVKNITYLQYASATWPVTAIDWERNIIRLNTKGETYSVAHTNEDGLYRLIGSLSFLDTPGEFYVDREENILYYYPYNADIESSVIVAPTVKRLVSFQGNGVKKPVRNIALSGLTFSTTDFSESFHQGDLAGNIIGSDAMIHLDSAENIAVSDCRIFNAGMSAVRLNGYAQNNVISGNFIKNVGYVGVLLTGYTARESRGLFDSFEDAYCNKNNTIHNNYIRKVGLNAAHGAGIQLFQSGDNLITHNEISHSPRYGISLKGEANPGGLRFWGIEIPESKIWLYDAKSMIYELRFAQNNYIAYNDLYDCMKETRDGGIFETNSAGRGNCFEHNRIHDTAAADVGGMFFGVYLDGGSVDWRVKNNVIYNLSAKKGGSSLIVNVGMNNQVENNIIDESNGNMNGVSLVGQNTVFNQNVIWSPVDMRVGGNSIATLYSMENNLYYSETGKYTVIGAPGEDTFTSWKNGGVYDQNSVVGELPGFVDAENHNYRFVENSPAKALGITDCAVNAGLTSDFLWERENNSMPVLYTRLDSGDNNVVNDPAGSLRIECESADYVKAASPTEEYIGGLNQGSYIGFYGVDLSNVTQLTVCYAAKPGYAGHLVEARLDKVNGTKVGSFVTKETETNLDFTTTTFSVTPASGKHALYLTFPDYHSGYGNFDWVRFETDNGIPPEKDILPPNSSAIAKGEWDFGDIILTVNGENLYHSGAYLSGKTLMIPLDTVVEKLGFTHDSKTATVCDTEGNSFSYTVGSDEILMNGKIGNLSANVVSKNGVFIPAEVFEIAFGDCVMWSEQSGYLRIMDVDCADLTENPDNPSGDLLWGKPGSTSRVNQQLDSLLDDDSETVWEAYNANREWIQLDLGNCMELQHMEIDWGERYARAFEIYVSDSDELPMGKKMPVYSNYTFGGGNWSREFSDISGRYLTIFMEAKSGMGAVQIKDIRISGK